MIGNCVLVGYASNNTFFDTKTMYTIDHELNLLTSSLQRGNRDSLACIPPTTMGLESDKTLDLVHTQPHMYVVLHRTTQNQHHNPSATEAHPSTNIQETTIQRPSYFLTGPSCATEIGLFCYGSWEPFENPTRPSPSRFAT
jgi:hypothetical protein